MSNKTTFSVSLRDGKKTVKQLRREGILPINIYGESKDSIMAQCPLNKFIALHRKMGESGLVYLQVEDKKEIPALFDEIQTDPISGNFLHVVFQKVNLKEKIEAEIPLEFVGEVNVPNSVLVHVQDSVWVEALPADLPEKIVVDVAGLTEIGQSITLADLKVDRSKVTISVGEEMGDTEPVVILQEVKEEVAEEPTGEEPTEAEVIGKGEEKAEGGEESGEKAESTEKED